MTVFWIALGTLAVLAILGLLLEILLVRRSGVTMQNTNYPLGFAMPSDFPMTEYLSINNNARKRDRSADGLQHFSGAWNAMVYRFDAVAAYQDALGPALERSRHGTSGSERSRQERDLFGFFSNGFSVFEATFYGLYSLGALVCPADFPISTEADQRKINLSCTIDCMQRAFPNDPIIEVLNRIKGDPGYASWSRVRNVLAHRVAPGRNLFVGGDETPTWKLDGLPLTAAMLQEKRSNLSRLLAHLLHGIDEFAASRL